MASNLAADARVLLRMLRGMPAGADTQSRLQAFYAPQAPAYDAFRERLLHGRAELIAASICPRSLRGRTGRRHRTQPGIFRRAPPTFAQVTVVDLCPSLLALARARCQRHGWGQVRCIEADATRYGPEAPVDAVYLSYALTMIPDWFSALDNALAMLKPGGVIGVVDFTVSPAQSALARRFWTLWFGHDGVRLNRAHVEALTACLPKHRLSEHRAPVPYLGGLKVCYYRFIGTRG